MNAKILAVLIVFLLPFHAIATSLWGSLQPGSYSAGFEIINRIDYSRPYKSKSSYEGTFYSGERGRPLQISVWYPAEKTQGARPLSFEDYISLTASEETLKEATAQEKQEAVTRFLKSRWGQGSDEEKLRSSLQNPLAAVRNAPRASGSFPLILIANSTGISSPFGNAILAEYLASHGYIVASSPALGATRRQIFGNEAHFQLGDLEFLINALRDLPSLNRDKLAVVGFGFGGLSAGMLAMNNTDVDALVSLDSQLGSKFGFSRLFKSHLYQPDGLSAPTLHIAAAQPDPSSDMAFFNSTKYSDQYHLRLSGLRSVDFSSLAMLTPLVPGFGGPAQGEIKVVNAKPGYETICRYIVHFLNASLKQDASGIDFLKKSTVENGVPEGLAFLEHKPGFHRPPTEEEFVQMIQKNGINQASLVYEQVARNDPEFRIFEPETLNGIAGGLIQNQKAADAIELLKLNVTAYPDDWEVHDMLGNAYGAQGDKKMAIEHYSKSLELNPENENAAEMIKKLQQS